MNHSTLASEAKQNLHRIGSTQSQESQTANHKHHTGPGQHALDCKETTPRRNLRISHQLHISNQSQIMKHTGTKRHMPPSLEDQRPAQQTTLSKSFQRSARHLCQAKQPQARTEKQSSANYTTLAQH